MYINNDNEINRSIEYKPIYCFDIQNPKGITIVQNRRNEASIGARYPLGIEIDRDVLITTLNKLSPTPRQNPNIY